MTVLNDPTTFKIAGFLGVFVGLIGVLIPGLVYSGTKGERYSFLNHFISELGEVGVSRFAWVFNLCMILCGICIAVASLSLGTILLGFWAKAGMLLGVIAGLALAFVGVFPMNKARGHMISALAFFRTGLLMVLLFSLSIVLHAEETLAIPRWLGLVGVFPVLAFGVFLGLMWNVREEVHNPLSPEGFDRPKVWKFAVSEWMIYFSLILWILVFAVGIA